jgi:RNA polymerase sigma factor (sigma-70 family)
MVRQCAAEIAARYPITAPELLGPGTVALHEAALAYDRQKHPTFPVYARHHIRGRMIDAIHDEPFSRGGRTKRIERVMERAFEVVSSHHVVDVDLFRDSEADILAGARRAQTELLAAAFMAGLIEDQRANPEDRMIDRITLSKALATLYPHELEVVRLVYEERMSVDQVGCALGIHPNTAQRRHASALRKLHAFFTEEREKPG